MPITKTVKHVFFIGLTVLVVFSGNLLAENTKLVTVNKERIIQTVRFLSETNYHRTSKKENKEKAQDYIVQSLKAAGFEAVLNELVVKGILCEPDFTEYSTNGNNIGIVLSDSRQTETHGNIHALKKGKTNKRMIIGAHYDTVFKSPGADDNASAVAVLIELAHLLNKTAELNCDVELVSYDLEENGLLGSRYHAAKLKKQNVDVVCMFCMDMVGYFSDVEHSQDYPVSALGLLYGTKGNFLALAGKPKDAELLSTAHKVFQQSTTLKIIPFPVPIGMDVLLSRSDHGYFWKEGYPALFLTDTAEYRNKNYHQPTDTWDTLDYDRLAQVPAGLYKVLLAIDAAQTSR